MQLFDSAPAPAHSLGPRGVIRLAAFSVCAVISACGAADPPRPNVLIVSIDTLNRSALHVYDPSAEELPNLARFASESKVFDRAYTPSSWTLPAHASLLTGLYPVRHGATQQSRRISSSVETIATHLGKVGYQTVAFTGGGFVDDVYGLDAGFDRFNDKVNDADPDPVELPRDGMYTPIAGSSLFDRTIAFLRGRKEESPFFAFVQTFAVHEYYQVRPWAKEQYPNREFASSGRYSACLDGSRRCHEEDWAAMRELYRAELRRLDEGFGRLLSELDRAGLRESTIVIFLSDHGEGFDPERDRIHHGGRLNSDLIHVPFLVRGPSIAPGRTEHAISLIDVLPTVLDCAHAAPASDVDGRSFTGVLHGADTSESRPLYAEGFAYTWKNGRRKELPDTVTSPASVAVIEGDRWYIRASSGDEELYDVAVDPDQHQNLAPRATDIAGLRSLAEARAKLRSSVERVEKDEATLQRLRQLGYVDR